MALLTRLLLLWLVLDGLAKVLSSSPLTTSEAPFGETIENKAYPIIQSSSNECSSNNDGAFDDNEGNILVRFHFIRHGETEGNREGLVLGRTDSPLTEEGIRQAEAAGRVLCAHSNMDDASFSSYWRIYSSDQRRARRTAEIMFQSGWNFSFGGTNQKEQEHIDMDIAAEGEDVPPIVNFVSSSKNMDKVISNPMIPAMASIRLDERLRELAKGAREGQPKSTSYEEAMKLYQSSLRREEIDDLTDSHNVELIANKEPKRSIGMSSDTVPLLEDEDDVWERVRDWIDEVLRDAILDHFEHQKQQQQQQKEKQQQQQQQQQQPPPPPQEGGGGRRENQELDQTVDIIRSNESIKKSSMPASSTTMQRMTRRYDVLAITHSGTLRTTIKRMVSDQLPPDIDTTPVGFIGSAARSNILRIPNLSHTIIDIIPRPNGRGNWHSGGKWSARLVQLADISHLRPSHQEDE